MKKIIFLLAALNFGTGYAQNQVPFFEQIAFDFYRTKIIDTASTKKRINIYPYASQFHPNFQVFSNPTCLGIAWKNNNQFEELESYKEGQLHIDSDRYELDLSDLNKKKFKIRRNKTSKLPIVFITPPHKERNGSEDIFVNVYENHPDQTVIYSFKFSVDGQIIDWCRTVNDIVRIK